jgi:uncharacterized membrane protein
MSVSIKATPSNRVQLIDVLRGTAIVLMAAYHFCFDLNYYAFTHFNFNYSLFWLGLRAFILTLFLGLVGISLTLATANGFNPQRYFRRLAWLAACATLVSISSRILFPDSWIFFGVLHFILLASVFGLAFLRLYWGKLILGAGLIAIGLTIQHPLFNHPWLQWFGLMTHKPITEDYVPLLPWFGVVLVGMFLGKRFLRSAWQSPLSGWHSDSVAVKSFALAGRHSLLIYMLHQPVLMGVLYGVAAFKGIGIS